MSIVLRDSLMTNTTLGEGTSAYLDFARHKSLSTSAPTTSR
nr:hypothetical protein [Nostoc sp. DedQUE02]